MISRDQYSLLLLAGGKSRRMGQNKAELLLEGKTFLAHMLEKGKALGLKKCYLSGFPAEGADAVTLWDVYPDRGPLGGLHACMQAMDTPYCLVLPVDAPTLPLAVAEGLLSAHEASPTPEKVLLWEHGDRKEPLIAVYPTAMAGLLEQMLPAGPAPVFRALDRWGYSSLRLELEREQVVNVNTPELYARILKENEKI